MTLPPIPAKQWRYAFIGLILGLIFPISALIIDSYRLDLSFSFASFQEIHSEFPAHYIIDVAPFIVAIMFMYIGRNVAEIQVKNEALQHSMHIKENFLASMSHEIRTPLNGIIGMVDMLSKTTDLDPTQTEYVDIIQKSSNHLLHIVNDILDLSKLEAGKMEIIHRPTEIKDLAEKVKNLFIAKARHKKLEIHTVYEDIPLYLKVDSTRMTQIISNFVSNAIKFTNEGSVTIKLSPAKEGFADKILKVEVIDTGVGINEAGCKAVFEEFSQLEQGDTIKAQGTGLGLAICSKFAKLMGGDIGVHSELGKGSTFWFTCNTEQLTDPEIQEIEAKKKEVKKKESATFNLHVLVVEDNPINQQIAKLMLHQVGCTTDFADNGKIGIEMFEEGKYDLIFMDVQMPEMGGVEATKELRKRFQNIPPIFCLSANAIESDAKKYMEQGMDDYISKPFTSDILHSKLQSWFA